MIDISSLLSSKARWKILRVLFYQHEPIPLRHVAYLSGMPVFSIQRALVQLLDEQVIVRQEKQSRVLFSLNKRSESYDFLAGLFALEVRSRLKNLSETYHQRARASLAFASQARSFFKTVRT